MGWLYIFIGDGARLKPDARLQRPARRFSAKHIGPALGIQQPLIVFVRELGIDWQPQRLALLRFARKLDGKVDHILAARPSRHLRRVLVDHKHLLQQPGQLGFAENTTGFNVGQQVLEIANASSQSLHFAQALVHLLQAVSDQLETFTQAGFERGLQLFIDSGPHLI